MSSPPVKLGIGSPAAPVPSAPALVIVARRSRLWRWLSVLCILAGLALGGDVAATLLWQEPVTAVIATVRRSAIDERWAHGIPLDRVDGSELASIHSMNARLAFLAAREARTAPDGAALGTIAIPAIGARFPLVQGTGASSLELGPGHYDQTVLPGERGTVAVAGHRTTFLAPFKAINELRAGDPIRMAMPYGIFTYTVEKLQIVAPDAWWITRSNDGNRLVLSSCNPLFSAAQRIVVFARLSGVTPTRITLRG